LREEHVVEDKAELLDGHVFDFGAEGLECLVGGSEDGYVGVVGEAGHYSGGVESTFEGGEVEGGECLGQVRGWNEEGVDYLDYYTAAEFEVLLIQL
jgi:hypothetical protein